MIRLTDNQTFYDLMAKLDFGRFHINPLNNLKYYLLSLGEVDNLNEDFTVLNASKGFYISGNPKNEIFLIRPYYENKKFKDSFSFVGEVIPGQYISGIQSYSKFSDKYSELESDPKNFFTSNKAEIPSNCKIFDNTNHKVSFLVLSEYPQMIFTKSTVKNHINKIVKLDN